MSVSANTFTFWIGPCIWMKVRRTSMNAMCSTVKTNMARLLRSRRKHWKHLALNCRSQTSPLDAIVDDDMKTEALPQTNNIKTLVTLEDKIDIERKGQQSVQGTLYVRFACFGNGSLHALYDKSNSFYRRQLLLTTKEKPIGRVDDPFLIDKMRNEKEGILLWALEGLHRLIRNNYRFTISERTAANLKEAMEQGNDILGFLKSEGYFEIRQGAKCKSTDFYKVYERWCLDNLEKPLAASTFIHHLKDNQKSLGIVYDDKCIGTNRGFHNVDIDLFLPVDVPSPWD